MKNKTFSRIYQMAKPHMKSIVIVSIIALILGIAEIIKPYLIEIVIDDYLSKGIVEQGILTIGGIGAIYIAIVIIGNILDFIATTTTNMMGEEIIYTMRNRLFKYTQNANIPFHDKTPAGKLFVRITNDIEDISTLFKDVISTFFKDILLCIAMIGMMIYLSAKLSIIALAVIPFVIIFSVVLMNILNKIYDKSKVIRTYMNTFFAESIYGAKLIKIFNIQNEKQKECEEYTLNFRNTRSKAGIIQALLPGLLTILENVGIALIVCACTNNWMGITMEVGYIYVFITYIRQLFEPITRIIENVEVVEEAVVSINKVYDILDEKQYLENFKDGLTLDKIKGKIEFRNVWF